MDGTNNNLKFKEKKNHTLLSHDLGDLYIALVHLQLYKKTGKKMLVSIKHYGEKKTRKQACMHASEVLITFSCRKNG